MTMTIGRAAINSDPYIGSLVVDGDMVSFGFDVGFSSLNECKARTQQLRGLVDNPDEEIVPFTWSLDATYDGFYRVRDVQSAPEASYLTTGFARFSITMERVGGYGRPQFESITQSTLRTNSHGVAAASGLQISWYAGGVVESDVTFSGIWSISIEDGLQRAFTVSTPSAATILNTSTVPADFYKNTAKIEVKYGSTWYPIHGDQIMSAVGLSWRISNGWHRITPSVVGGDGRFTVESNQAGAWGTGREYCITTGAGATPENVTGSVAAPSSLRIVRNTPEAVTVRVRQQAESGKTFDFTLRQGDPFAEISITSPSSATTQLWGIRPSSAVASTAFTGGVRSTAATAGRYGQVSCPSTITTDAVAGGIRLTAAALTAVFQVSEDADVAGTGLSATGMRDLFLAARSQRVRIVPR